MVEKFAVNAEGGDIRQIIKEEKQKFGNTKFSISLPLMIEQTQHAGWDPVGQTFNTHDMPKEIK